MKSTTTKTTPPSTPRRTANLDRDPNSASRSPTTLNGAQILHTLLERQGITTLAGIPGGAILPFYDALHSATPQHAIQHVLTRHEQGAGFIAQGMARVTGRAAVCLATSGPGATNLLTAIADARLDSIPLVAITAQVPQSLIGTDAFQEVDTYGLTLPITKHNFLVRSVETLLEIIPLAFTLAESGRPGPVAIDIPKDVLTATLEITTWPEPGGHREAEPVADALIDEFAQRLAAAERPVLYFGGGIIASGASDLACQLAHRLSSPVVSTLMALGAMPSDDPLFMGMLGMHATRGTNLLLEEADLLVAIGARFDDRATGKVAEFCPHAAIAHIDIDPAEIGKIKQPFLSLVGDASDILRRTLKRLNPEPDEGLDLRPVQSHPDWHARATELRTQYPLEHPPKAEDPLHPINLCHHLSARLPDDTIVVTDVGQHQMWVAQAWPFRKPRTLLTSGGLGTMGFGMPAAIGAAIALSSAERAIGAALGSAGGSPAKRNSPRVICVSGDGSILMNIQELATLAELDLPVAILICNNGHLGLVRQQQELFYDHNYAASRFQGAPDFAAIARGFGLRGVRIDPNAADPLAEIDAALDQPGPCVIDIPIHAEANVYPMVPPGAANRHMISAHPFEPSTSHD